MMTSKNPYRSDFPIFTHHPELIYLDSAATTHKPEVVIHEMTTFMEQDYATVHRAIYSSSQTATQKYHQTRELVAQFLSATPKEVVFTRGTTTALNFLARALEGLAKEGDAILISTLEHHANFLPWVELCKRKRLKLIQVPYHEGKIDLSFVEQACRENSVFAMSIAHISNFLGIEQPISELTALLHRYGAFCILDAAQSSPHHKLNVNELGVDFLAFSGHKTYGPTGIGILYGRADLLQRLPPIEFGGDMVLDATTNSLRYHEPPWRFEAGTPSIIEVIGLGSAIRYLMQLDRDSIAKTEKALIAKLAHQLQEIGNINIIGPLIPERGTILSFTFDDLHPLDVATLLDTKGICVRTGHLCAQPALQHFGISSCMRASVGLYTEEREIDFFVDQLKEVCTLLRS